MPEAEVPQSAVPPFEDVPRHVAIIMDGNGRWAAARGLPRVEGHRRGVEALAADDPRGERHRHQVHHHLLLQRGKLVAAGHEVGELMGLLRRFIRNDLAELHKQQRARARDRRARPARSRYRPPAGGGGRAHQEQ